MRPWTWSSLTPLPTRLRAATRWIGFSVSFPTSSGRCSSLASTSLSRSSRQQTRSTCLRERSSLPARVASSACASCLSRKDGRRQGSGGARRATAAGSAGHRLEHPPELGAAGQGDGAAAARATEMAATDVGRGIGRGDARRPRGHSDSRIRRLTSAPAFAVTVTSNGSVQITLREFAGISGANAKLARLGFRIRVVPMTAICPTKVDMSYIGFRLQPTSVVALTRPHNAPGVTIVLAAAPSGGNRMTFAVGRVRGQVPACVSSRGVGPGLPGWRGPGDQAASPAHQGDSG